MLKFANENENDVFTYYVNRLYVSYFDDRDPDDVCTFDYELMELLDDYDGRSNRVKREKVYETRNPADAIDRYLDIVKTCGYTNTGTFFEWYGVEIERYSIERGTARVLYTFRDPDYKTSIDLATTDFTRLSENVDGRTFVSVVDMITGDHMQTTCKTLRAAKAWATKAAEKIAAKYTLIAGRDDVRFVYHRDYTGLAR